MRYASNGAEEVDDLIGGIGLDVLTQRTAARTQQHAMGAAPERSIWAPRKHQPSTLINIESALDTRGYHLRGIEKKTVRIDLYAGKCMSIRAVNARSSADPDVGPCL
jgi:hypothetical protein